MNLKATQASRDSASNQKDGGDCASPHKSKSSYLLQYSTTQMVDDKTQRIITSTFFLNCLIMSLNYNPLKLEAHLSVKMQVLSAIKMVQQLRTLEVAEDLGLVPRFTEWLKTGRCYALYWPLWVLHACGECTHTHTCTYMLVPMTKIIWLRQKRNISLR